MQLSELNFVAAYECRLDPQAGISLLERLATHPNDDAEGVYVVMSGDEIAYIGSYKSGLHKRWGYKNNPAIYHFRKVEISGAISAGRGVKVWALSLNSIKKQIRCAGNKWINSASVEAHLIAEHNPPWNKQGKRRKKSNL